MTAKTWRRADPVTTARFGASPGRASVSPFCSTPARWLIDQTSAIERDELPFLHEALVNQGGLGDGSIPTWLTSSKLF
jgi:hypothetical protein